MLVIKVKIGQNIRLSGSTFVKMLVIKVKSFSFLIEKIVNILVIKVKIGLFSVYCENWSKYWSFVVKMLAIKVKRSKEKNVNILVIKVKIDHFSGQTKKTALIRRQHGLQR